ncbi:MAG: enoyl-CoA hydratase/isomerase family protein [Flavobacteriales bacterium]|tara:strand:- start:640 stop:1419 length:780 start_codon:yes stop_codon:yes gene_type:complete
MERKFTNYRCQNRVGFITLCRSEKRNALNNEFVTQLSADFSNAIEDPDCKVIVLEAEGTVFCGGADLQYLQNLQNNSFEENVADSDHLMQLFKKIYFSPKLVISNIQGHAIAGGCGLATVCDISIASEKAKFGYPEVNIGFIPAIVSVFLLKKVGETIAKDLLLTGRKIDAIEAQKIGLITKVVEEKDLKQYVLDLANRACNNNSAQSVLLTKELMHKVHSMSVEDGLNEAVLFNANARKTDDFKKGIASFLNNEKLTW